MNMAFFPTVIFTSILIKLSVGFNMAVVEYSPRKNDEPLNTILENINEYRKYLETNRHQNVDVMVFPEYGLTGFVEDVENYAIEINKKSKVINELSAMSSEYNINMVVNLLEKFEDSDIYCNTNLVFNKKGVIIAKYRKINLNPETESKLTAGNEVVEFTLEGRHFSTITNDDILFEYPTNNFSDYVSHVAIPMNWENTGLLNTATSLQAAYAQKTGKIVLAANINDPDRHKSGSGLYSLNDSHSFITQEKVNRLITSDQTRNKRQQELTPSLNEKILLNIDDFMKENHVHGNASDDSKFEYRLTTDNISCVVKFPFYNFVLEPLKPNGYLSGYQRVKINGQLFEIRTCVLLFCEGLTFEQCKRKQMSYNFFFPELSISATMDFKKSYPIAVDVDLKPIPNVTWTETNGETVLKVENIKQINAFAIVEYTPVKEDKVVNENHSKSSNEKIRPTLLLIVGAIVFILSSNGISQIAIISKSQLGSNFTFIKVQIENGFDLIRRMPIALKVISLCDSWKEVDDIVEMKVNIRKS